MIDYSTDDWRISLRLGILMEKWLENSGISMVDCIAFGKRELHGIIQNLARYGGWLAKQGWTLTLTSQLPRKTVKSKARWEEG